MDSKTFDITEFSEFTVYTEKADSLKLASYWGEKIAVFLFIRHFG